ncbi:MAG: transcriptional regulatory protein RtcR [bacterium]|jgi:transcriptional regulatory protein RtcR
MKSAKPKVVIGLLGSVLDRVKNNPERFEKWRPTVSLFQHEDLEINRFELIHQRQHKSLSEFVASDIQKLSPKTVVNLHQLNFNDPWDFEEVYGRLHDFATAYSFKTEKEDYLFHITTGTHVAQICTYLLTEAHYFPGKLLQSSPSQGRMKPDGSSNFHYQFIDLDLSKYDQIASRFEIESLEGQSYLKSGIKTKNESFNQMIDHIEQVAIRSKAPILMLGPTGAGKSHLATRIFNLKKARSQVEGKFVEVNCATIRGDGAMSTLFGHKKGSFTGALKDREGLLLAANHGVLFLDEIGELGLDEQAMLLRALEEKRFLPVGSDQESESDFQLIAGTNRNLHKEVLKGNFREDLLARINLWTFKLPALADRKEDIAPNLEYELLKFAKQSGTSVSFNQEAKQHFLDFALSPQATWNANFRDLNAATTRMATLAIGGRITLDLIQDEIQRLKENWKEFLPSKEILNHSLILEEFFSEEEIEEIDQFDFVQLCEVVHICQTSSSLSDAGRKLFSKSREKKKAPNDADRLSKYLKRFNLTLIKIKG